MESVARTAAARIQLFLSFSHFLFLSPLPNSGRRSRASKFQIPLSSPARVAWPFRSDVSESGERDSHLRTLMRRKEAFSVWSGADCPSASAARFDCQLVSRSQAAAASARQSLARLITCITNT